MGFFHDNVFGYPLPATLAQLILVIGIHGFERYRSDEARSQICYLGLSKSLLKKALAAPILS